MKAASLQQAESQACTLAGTARLLAGEGARRQALSPNLATGGVTQTTTHNNHHKQIAQKEKSHVVDYHRNSNNLVANRLFRSEHKSKLPANRWLDPYFDRYRCHTYHIARVGDRLIPRFTRKQEAVRQAASS